MLDVLDHRTASGNEVVRELRLARPPANALGPELLAALGEALSRAPSEGVSAVILSGAPGRFSGGMDVPALLAMDRAGLTATWGSFFSVVRALATYPLPVVAALTGHSPAGGTVLSLFADYRIFADGPFVVGLNEVQVGLPVPSCLLQALTFVVGVRQAARLATCGLLVGPAEARAVGLVDEVVAVSDVVPRALAWLGDLLGRPRHAMLATRARARAPLAAAAAEMTPALIEDVVAAWQTDECQRTMRALAARLKSPPPRT
jgi:enoyl-CoA hydratase/carnithine racemase